MKPPKFYYTAHPGDTIRGRLIPNSQIMVVATAYWNNKKKKFKVRRPPADHIKSLAIDSGGYTAHRRWGKYPWSHTEYIEFIRKMSRDVKLDFCAIMDYACEREVNRETYKTNRERILATQRNEYILRELAPDLPWLGVLQGNTLCERAWDIKLRQKLGLIQSIMGIGSICGRSPRESKEVIRFYMKALPGIRYHAFGLDIRALDNADDVFWALQSWDSYAWNWGRGMKKVSPEKQRLNDESWSEYTLRLAQLFEEKTLNKRLRSPRQRNFFSQINQAVKANAKNE